MTERRDSSEHNQLIRFWCDTYQERVGVRYPFNGGKDGATVKWLRSMYTDDEIRTFMVAFFDMEDEWIEDKGHSLGLLRSCLPKVIQFVRRGQQQVPKKAPANLTGIQAWMYKKATGA